VEEAQEAGKTPHKRRWLRVRPIKKAIKKAVYAVASSGPVAGLARRIRLAQRAVVLAYHDVSPDRGAVDAWLSVRRCDFIRQMRYLKEHFRVVSLGLAFDEMNGEMHGPSSHEADRPLAVVTFDDGYSGVKETALPVITEMKMPVTVYAATGAIESGNLYWYDRLLNGLHKAGAVDMDMTGIGLGSYRLNQCEGARNWQETSRLLEDIKKLAHPERDGAVRKILERVGRAEKETLQTLRPLNVEEMKELSASPLVTIGAHSHSHRELSKLTDEEMQECVGTSKRLLEEWTGRSIDHFSYPNGDYSPRVITALKDSGFISAVTEEPGLLGRETPAFAIPRLSVGRYDSLERFKTKVSGMF
jgi:peptidoglycan/xylan/chitin deacetylase (PgdA/CDA1 family)